MMSMDAPKDNRGIKATKAMVGFNQYDIEATESWLTDMARQGWMLEYVGINLSHFVREEPKEGRRYRIAPVGTSFWSGRTVKFTEEQKEIFESSGWTVCAYRSGLAVLYSDDPDAPELFDDMKSFRSFGKRYIRDALICMALAVWLIYIYMGPTGLLWTVFELYEAGARPSDGVEFWWMPVFFVEGLLICLIEAVVIPQAVTAIYTVFFKGRSLEHDKPYKKSVIMRRCIVLLLAAALIAAIIAIILTVFI